MTRRIGDRATLGHRIKAGVCHGCSVPHCSHCPHNPIRRPLNPVESSLIPFTGQWLTLALLYPLCLLVLFKLVGYLWSSCTSFSSGPLIVSEFMDYRLSVLFCGVLCRTGPLVRVASLLLSASSTLNWVVPRLYTERWIIWDIDHPNVCV
jgi:hypothetical protein